MTEEPRFTSRKGLHQASAIPGSAEVGAGVLVMLFRLCVLRPDHPFPKTEYWFRAGLHITGSSRCGLLKGERRG